MPPCKILADGNPDVYLSTDLGDTPLSFKGLSGMHRIVFLVLIVVLGGCTTAPTGDAQKNQPAAKQEAQPESQVVDLKDLDVPPEVVYQVVPTYPEELKSKQIRGEVLVAFIVERDGKVGEAYVIQASHPGLGEAALQTVRQWRFAPPLYHGQPVRIRLQVPIRFGV